MTHNTWDNVKPTRANAVLVLERRGSNARIGAYLQAVDANGERAGGAMIGVYADDQLDAVIEWAAWLAGSLGATVGGVWWRGFEPYASA